jgi:hypothetical protein
MWVIRDLRLTKDPDSIKYLELTKYLEIIKNLGQTRGPKVSEYDYDEFEYDDHPMYALDTYGDDYEEPQWSVGALDPSGENFDFGNIIPQMDGTFLGETYLTLTPRE